MNLSQLLRSTIIMVLFVIVGCSHANEDLGEKFNLDNDIKLTSHAHAVGFSLHTPTQDSFEAMTTVDIEGSIENMDGVEWEHIWITITSKEATEGIESNDFNYYIPIENGIFTKQITLHSGLGSYEVIIRSPSNKGLEKNMYYDLASFNVHNLDVDIQRQVEYTAYGSERRLYLTQPKASLQDFESSVFIEGTISPLINEEMVLVQVKKGNESEQLSFPLIDGSFSGDIPLYFGEGLHIIRVQTYNEADEFYYESAIIYAHNPSSIEFAKILKTEEYVNRGITLYEPSWVQNKTLNKREYQIKGEIDQTEDIEYIIVSVNHLEDDLESGYVIPVENGKFDGLAYFRFGPGNYEVVISVPTKEQHDQSMFHYQGVVKINHQLIDIEDGRGLLPSRGTESDHPAIIEQAKQITVNLNNDRDKAKAIYKFVAQHVAYDVKKAENDLFNIGDSALSTLQSESGICQDYAFLATALLRAIGMQSHYVQGDAGERHAWVEVKVDGEWIEMDPTWGAGYIQEGVFNFHYNEAYFDPDPDFLAETHTRDGVMY